MHCSSGERMCMRVQGTNALILSNKVLKVREK